ncbi:hypothetical protein [Micromonospora andamanensis]|uniref:hypothetical protein n=1 Tax=Micromonospora andamanensis TaxID=1287068 RepID=UPI00194F25A8|nr:hypothetical protein [Micromonospora andamanensis]GIJ37104.1 hypothetical protein Vwe01_04290 [Micromonospora andamanensis]
MSRTAYRHAVGACVAWGVFVAQAPVIYAGLLVYAWRTAGDPGGPLALPAICFSLACLGVALVPLLFVPAVWIGEKAPRNGRLSVKLPVAIAVAAVLAAIYVTGIAALTEGSIAVGTLVACLGGVGAVLCPTAAYVVVAHRKLKASSV